ncbi:hypothetical protein BH10PSE1_BH10PSE1_20900 [soil metagenome]
MAQESSLTDTQRRPTAAIARQAERGLKLREKHGRGGTGVGVRRAHQLANRESVSDADIKSIYSYFARHAVDKKGMGWAHRSEPSAGYIAWLLWGGDAAETWIRRLHSKLETSAKSDD